MTSSPEVGGAATSRAGDVIREHDARMNDHDLGGAVELWAPHGTLIWPVGVWEGQTAIRDAFDELLTALPDYKEEIDLFIEDGNHVACEVRAMGTFSGGPLGGFEPTGADITQHMTKIYTVEEGRIVRGRVYYDQMEFARETGLMPEQDSIGERAMTQMLNAVTKVRNALDQARPS